jgi:hypothetical protein
VPDAGEVDEAPLRVGVDQLQAHPVPDVESRRSLLDAALDGRIEDARPGSLGRGAGDDPVELLADVLAQQAGGRRLAHQTFDLLRAILLQCAVRGERLEGAAGVRDLGAGQRRLEQPLGDEVWIAAVGRR